ncbi:hypothetical protein J1614_004243 [Plenodomus biglobosus]|nr:hypothetical protein J1614_004243 [Plenodomus biglobosus]
MPPSQASQWILLPLAAVANEAGVESRSGLCGNVTPLCETHSIALCNRHAKVQLTQFTVLAKLGLEATCTLITCSLVFTGDHITVDISLRKSLRKLSKYPSASNINESLIKLDFEEPKSISH